MRKELALALTLAIVCSSSAMADTKASDKKSSKTATSASKSKKSAKKSSAKTTKKSTKKAPKKTKKKAKIKIPQQKMPPGFKQALMYQAMNVFDKAIPMYQKAIAQDPKFISSYNNLAQCLIKRNGKGDKEEAKKYLKKSLELDPKNIGCLHTNALLLESDKKYIDAEECYRKILKMQPLNFRAVQNLSELLFRTGKRREAREVLVTVLKKDPPDQHKKVYQQALKNLDKKIKEKSKSKTG